MNIYTIIGLLLTSVGIIINAKQKNKKIRQGMYFLIFLGLGGLWFQAIGTKEARDNLKKSIIKEGKLTRDNTISEGSKTRALIKSESYNIQKKFDHSPSIHMLKQDFSIEFYSTLSEVHSSWANIIRALFMLNQLDRLDGKLYKFHENKYLKNFGILSNSMANLKKQIKFLKSYEKIMESKGYKKEYLEMEDFLSKITTSYHELVNESANPSEKYRNLGSPNNRYTELLKMHEFYKSGFNVRFDKFHEINKLILDLE